MKIVVMANKLCIVRVRQLKLLVRGYGNIVVTVTVCTEVRRATHLHTVPFYIKSTRLPACALNVGIRCKLCGAETPNNVVVQLLTVLLTTEIHSLTDNRKMWLSMRTKSCNYAK